MTEDMLHVAEWHNGDKQYTPFSNAEMIRRQADLRLWMGQNDVDAVLCTSQHCITYYSGWLYRAFGRKYGMVLTQTDATVISAGVDGGQPWRRIFGRNLTYTDWRRDNFYRAVRQLTPRVTRLAIEFDHVSLDFRRMLDAALPGVEMVDVGQVAMRMRAVKSPEELALIRTGARICDIGGAAAVAAIAAGVAEHEVAMAATCAMTRDIAATFPFVELTDTGTWFRSGINTDGAHTPASNKRIRSGEILSLTCFPSVFGYSTSLGRTLFCDSVDKASLSVWEKNLAVRHRGLALVRHGAKCNDIALELNDMYRQWDLLKYRSAGYGHSFGILGHYYGREAAVELREDVETVLQAGMVVSIGPMVMLPDGTAGAGGYAEQDILIVTDQGADILTRFPAGPDHNVIPIR